MGEESEEKVEEVTIPIKPKRHPMIALPIYGGKLEVPLFHSLERASMECVENGWETPLVVIRSLDSIITRARNAAIACFMSQTQCTDLIYVDGDISWEPGHFARLMSHDVDIVAGVYRSRGEPENPICQAPEGGVEVDEKTGLIALAGIGTGFFRITRNAVQRMLDAYGHRWYEDKATAPGLKLPCLFDFEFKWHNEDEFLNVNRQTFMAWQERRGERPEGADDIDEVLRFIWDNQVLQLNASRSGDTSGGIYFSEDYVFCQRARALGMKVWADPQLIVYHSGEKIYPFRFISWLNQEYLKAHPTEQPSTEDLARAILTQEEQAMGMVPADAA